MSESSVKQPARLTALRLVGFKSFAERTTIEFGPGISAVVGPNGSGKSNLADALRWTLGEQGRQLRTRRAEDVIFAGSSSRKAIGMADVTLVIDNADRLLPVDFAEVEIGRRLYRSGENEYLLNRQRIRLRDLVETLDAGNLADNAFLFIGQGMVDQALALRPEERRPLFEEAAGVRRHERRRRQAEHELSEAEANLERLRDLLGELRPQAKRLAAQAEQLQARRTAGLELAEALLSSARARWIASAATERLEAKQLREAHDAADAALADLHAAEEEAASTSEQMASHAEQERERRDRLERHRARVVELRVTQARLESEIESLARESGRLTGERESLDARLRDSTFLTSTSAPAPDPALAADIANVERALAEASVLVGADGDAAVFAAFTRDLDSRKSESQKSAARATDAETAAGNAAEQVARLKERLAQAETERDTAVDELATTAAAETAAQTAHDDARAAATQASSSSMQLADQLRQLETEAASSRAALAALESALEATVDDALARAARARGGSLVAEGLEVESRFRQAVSAALGAAATGLAVDDAAPLLSTKRQGTLVVRGGSGRRRTLASGTASGPVVAAARERGGGSLTEAIRRDPQSEVTRLLDRVVWVPDMGAALRLAPSLLPGWRCVTLAGDVISDEGVIWLASERSVLDQRAERDALRRKVSDLDKRLTTDRAAAAAARESADTAIGAVASSQQVLDEARKARRAAEERERVAQRRAEQWLRELTWETSQAERLGTEAASARDSADRANADLAALEARLSAAPGTGPPNDAHTRIAELTARREHLLTQRAAEEQRLHGLQEQRRNAEVRRAIDETRLAEIEAEQTQLAPRQLELAAQKDQLAVDLAAAQTEEEQASAALNEVLQIGAADRGRLIEAERAAADARERLRVAEQQTRRSEVTQMEARLQLEQIREQLLVELAGIGTDGLLALHHANGGEGDAPALSEEDVASGAAYEAALAQVVDAWQSTDEFDQQAIDAPGPSRIGSLRRRFHELGAGNPFAAEEYEELRERLDAMETQRADLESAISSTRELIANLTAMITDQFRKTFAALEDAFARRFKELFGGGDAELSLTAPEDLSATGVEIHARPPGKKRQPLSMLSGGERALTAVSLLLAMLEVRPVPFCVLDEVDAALDEANVSRFSKALRGLAEQTQFIVITHNRGTIEGADALYGVTIGDDAVSRVISLRLPKPTTNGDNGKAISIDETTDVEPVEPSEATLA